MSYTLENPFQYFPDSTQFGTIGLGSLYIGQVNGNPASNPLERIQAYIARQGLPDLAISQPISISAGGVPLYQGSPVTIKVNSAYSVVVLDYLGAQVYYSPSSGNEITELVSLDSRVDALELSAPPIIASWSSISGITPTAAGQIFTLSQHTSGGLGGGTLISVAGSVADDGGTQKNALGGFYLKRINYIYATPEMFGAIGNNVVDDHVAVQAAVDTKLCAFTNNTVYFIGTTGITCNKNNSIIIGNNAQLRYTGSADAFAGIAASNVYPQSCAFSDFSVNCPNSVTTGFNVRFSFSNFTNIYVLIQGSNSTAWRLTTDFVFGTGPYYNNFYNCCVVGKVGITVGVTNQSGWLFTTSVTAPTRGPNTNNFYGGRTSQVNNPWTIAGSQNRIIATTCEGTTAGGYVFTFQNAFGAGAGCSTNLVAYPYVEGDVAGANFVLFGTNSTDNHVDRPYVTSIGPGTYVTDTSGNTTNTITDNFGMSFANAASANPRQLDYYLENTAAPLSPTVAGSTTPGTQTYALNKAYSTRIGNIIFPTVNIIMTTKDAATAGNVLIKGGLPVIASALSGNIATLSVSSERFTLTGGYTTVRAEVVPGTTDIALMKSGSGLAPTNMVAADLVGTSSIYISGSYMV